MIVSNRIITCNCNVYDKKLHDIGVDSEVWMGISFKIDDLVYVREDMLDSGSVNEFSCLIMLKHDTSEWMIDVPYLVMLKVWENK